MRTMVIKNCEKIAEADKEAQEVLLKHAELTNILVRGDLKLWDIFPMSFRLVTERLPKRRGATAILETTFANHVNTLEYLAVRFMSSDYDVDYNTFLLEIPALGFNKCSTSLIGGDSGKISVVVSWNMFRYARTITL